MKQKYFFAQSCQDALNDYMYSCANTNAERWDWVILTAANQRQAEAYEMQLQKRERENRLPRGTKFRVVADYKDQRIGSGGATFNVIRQISGEIGAERLFSQKILVIHSGGDSKRIPQYSACGKLFAPVLRILPGGYVSSVFDELLIAAADIPNRCQKGMMVFPGDTQLLFHSLQLDLFSCDAAGLSMKASAGEGGKHGVFLQGKEKKDRRNYDVERFFHKLPDETLRKWGAVDAQDQVDIDTGCIWLGSRILRELWGLISTDGVLDQEKFDFFVNPRVCLNFYADFVYPLASHSSLEEFWREAPENGYTEELKECRRRLFESLGKYRLSLVKLAPAKYIHFGTTQEMHELLTVHMEDYSYLGWVRRLYTNARKGTALNSYVSEDTKLPERCLIENSVLLSCQVGEDTVLSNVDVNGIRIPADTALHGLPLKNGKFVCRIYGKDADPKGSACDSFLMGTLADLMERTGIGKEALWEGDGTLIWDAKLYPECPTMPEAVKAAVGLYEILAGTASEETVRAWKAAKRYSLHSSFLEADLPVLMKRQNGILKKVFTEAFVKDIKAGGDMTELIDRYETAAFLPEEWIGDLEEIAGHLAFPENMRLFLACSDLCRKYGIDTERQSPGAYEDQAYFCVSETIRKEVFQRFGMDFRGGRFVKDFVQTELPVRVNFCGSPSDAAPYCLEHGGTMLDGALLLKGKKPIKVTAARIREREIRLGSRDQGCVRAFSDLGEVRNCQNPYDPYALHKAVLVAAGLIPWDISGVSMEQFCRQFGGGLELVTEADVPKGSGLGTSSIIAAAAVKAVNELCGIEAVPERVYAQVFLAEQLMTTGGGWQDQVGGFTEGIKYFTALPGAYQEIQVERLALPEGVLEELNRRFALIFSGQRRLARNVLREEMNQCIRNKREALETVEEIRQCCAVMRYFLQKGDVTSFARCVSKQFELVKKLDKGASNPCIEYIFDVCEDLLDGRSICGAGGGGFLQVILKKDVTKEMLKERIRDAFADCGVEVWDCQLI